MTTFADELPRQQARCREILEVATLLGVPGMFLSQCIKRSLARADQAAAAGDVVAMLRALQDLSGYSE